MRGDRVNNYYCLFYFISFYLEFEKFFIHRILNKHKVVAISLIRIERIYDNPNGKGDDEDGDFRILIDRLWPRGLSKNEVNIDLWLKDVAPSASLRKWFNHDEKKWDEFRLRYFKELEKCPKSLNTILDKMKEGSIILLYGAKDEKFNNAIALKEYLENIKK